MFSDREVDFLNTEITRFSKKIEERLLSDELADQQRQRLEGRMVVAASIMRKLEYDKQLRNQRFQKTPSVLVVDDMRSALEVNKQHLMQVGFKRIDTASDGAVAFKKLKDAASVGSPYGIVICDWEMPKMSGLELLEHVRKDKDLWAVPFYLLSSRSEKRDILQAINIGATGYFSKPVNLAALGAQLKEYIVS